MKRISKRQARKLFNRGEKVYMAPSKMNIWSMWFSPVCMDNNEDFEKNVNAFRYYNCNEETGKVVYYYTY